MPRKIVRVNIPQNPTEAIRLMQSVNTRHTDLGDSSPLGGLKWADLSPAVARAAEHDAKAKEIERELEKRYRERDKEMPLIIQGLRSARDVLLGVNADNPKVLGDFGYTVDDTARNRAAKTDATKTPAG
jgi:hypothetical protein